MTRLIAFAIAIVGLLTAAGAFALADRADESGQAAMASLARSTTASRIAKLEATVAAHPNDLEATTQLASAYLVRARETGDPSFYTLADTAVKRVLEKQPDNVSALIVAGGLALSRHDFAGAMMLAERARSIEPSVVATYGVLTDANVELGRYDEAIAAAQQMADLHPDFASLSRISYIRELHGDLGGAIESMRRAVDTGSSIPQDVVWGRTLLGNLYLTKGDIDGAARQFDEASRLLPDDPAARAGQARLAIIRGDLASAETDLRAAIAQRPQPDSLIALGDLLTTHGRTREADQQYATVRAIQQLFVANGGDADIELALFDADHGVDPQPTFEKARLAYERRQSVTAADAVSWAAYKAGRIDDARAYSALAMRLGTRDAKFAYHAGVIAEAAGDLDSAKCYLRDAAVMAPSQSLLYVASAREALDAVASAAAR